MIHKRQDVFGLKYNVDEYAPERWIEANKEELKEMNGNMFQFGAGSRTCIGKNISLLEVYKLVPSFLRRFEVSPHVVLEQGKDTILTKNRCSLQTRAKTGSYITVSPPA